jgi:translation initiation factor 5
LIKYFGFELGAQTNTGNDDRWIVNGACLWILSEMARIMLTVIMLGAHEASKLQDHLDGFITKFVLW